MIDAAKIHKTLNEVFGFSEFRPHQERIIHMVLEGKNTLAVLPTGHGKSLCYQLPAVLTPGTTLVFSPLIALMKDQVDALNRRFGIPSISLNSAFRSADRAGYEKALEGLADGAYKLVYVAPEHLHSPRNVELLRRAPIRQVVVDEAHCVSLWGHDFRPHYRKIIEFSRSLGDAAILAVTATAPPSVEKDILRQLGEGSELIRASSARANLRLHVVKVAKAIEKYAALERIISRLKGSGIVYVGTHEECERVSGFLNQVGIKARFYHGGLQSGRSQIQEGFMRDRWKVTVATCALGMGIDKRNIRFIIHFRFPGNPELYYQEIGRAGRDGEPADCILLYDGDDVALQDHFLEKNYPTREQCREVLRVLSFDHPKRVRELALETNLETSQVNNILFHLVDRGAVGETDSYKETEYRRVAGGSMREDLTSFDRICTERFDSLKRMIEYSHSDGCLMEYLCSYLGDIDTHRCGECSNCKGYHYDSYLLPTKNVEEFMKEWRPRLAPVRSAHDGGYCLDYYSYTEVGDVLREDKYGRGEGYRQWLVAFAEEAIRAKYPVGEIDAVCSVPTTKDLDIVGLLARSVAKGLGIPYRRLLKKVRTTDPQKGVREKERKRENIQRAYEAAASADLEGKTVLLIDDVYDSGWTLVECARKLRDRSAKKVYVFTLARTHHADDL